jgi:hypothetical protein
LKEPLLRPGKATVGSRQISERRAIRIGSRALRGVSSPSSLKLLLA